MVCDNPNVGCGMADCSLYTRRNALTDDYHKKWMGMLGYAPVECNFSEPLAIFFNIHARQNHFIQENIFSDAPVGPIAIAMNTNSAFIDCTIKVRSRINNFISDNLEDWEVVRQKQTLMRPFKSRFYVTPMKAMNFQDDTPQFQLIISKTTM